MHKFISLRGVAAPFPMMNVDTDMIIPKQFLKSPSRTGYGRALFYELRFDANGVERPEFVLNRAPYRNARILVAGDNFGCGSSREHAPWALAQFGIRCIIAPSFADIFESNCFNNSILPVTLERRIVNRIAQAVADPANAVLTVDLVNQVVVAPDGDPIAFDVDPYRRVNLLEGLDPIGLTLLRDAEIGDFEAGHWRANPWLHPQAVPKLTKK